MNTDIKQAMHVEAAKSFGTSEANENERRWNEDKVDCKNQDPTNNYDKTRMRLNFEIGPDGKIHPTVRFNRTVAPNLSLAAIMNVHLRWLLAIRPSI